MSGIHYPEDFRKRLSFTSVLLLGAVLLALLPTRGLAATYSTVGFSEAWIEYGPAQVSSPIPGPTGTPVANLQTTVTVAFAYIHSGPGKSFPRVTFVRHGQRLTVTGQASDCTWLQIVTPSGETGWISGNFADLNVACDPLPETPTTQATSTPTNVPRTPSPTVAAPGIPVLISPDDGATASGSTRFVWAWNEPSLAGNEAFEVRMWKADHPHHYQATRWVRATSAQFDVTRAYGVRRAGIDGDHFWTVALVETDPYKRTGEEAPARVIRVVRSVPTLVPISTPDRRLIPPSTPTPTPTTVRGDPTPRSRP